MNDATRVEHDSMGELNVPIDASYGAQTQRAIDNFDISGLSMPPAFIRALGLIKSAAAQAPQPIQVAGVSVLSLLFETWSWIAALMIEFCRLGALSR